MSFENGFAKMNFFSKISFTISWLNNPKGKSFIDTTKIFLFKITHIFEILGFLAKQHNLSQSIILAKNNFNSDKIYVTAKNSDGFLFKITCGADLEIISSNREEFVIQKFHPCLGDVVFDVGANIGVYSLKSSFSVSPSGKIIAIEADPEIFGCLKKNILINSINNIIPLNYAVFDKKETVSLYRSTLSSPTNSLEKIPNAQKIDVQANSLDNIFDELNLDKVDWIKIDVEGVEKQVLDGATKIFEKNLKLKLIIEVHKKELEPIIENFLKKYNFEIEWERGEMNSPHVFAQR